jgi:receptor expression-enhancing protein 1/2/3/4
MLLWLLLPSTRGSTLLYRRLVHPTLVAKEKEIDAALDRWRQEGYTLGVRYTKVAAQTITKTMVETALRGGGG